MRGWRWSVLWCSLLLALLASARWPERAYACTCRPMYPEMQLAIQELVFLARVERVERLAVQPPIGLTLAVRRVWKGEVPPIIEANYQLACDSPPDFVPGKSYLIYGRGYEGWYLLSDCNRIVPMGLGAWHDVLFLTAWDMRIAGPVLIGLQLLLRWRGRRAARVAAGGA
jgi:hypothetical protein